MRERSAWAAATAAPAAAGGAADGDTDGRQFVFGLHDRKFVFTSFGVNTEFFAILLKGFGYRCTRCDGVPSRDGGATVDQA